MHRIRMFRLSLVIPLAMACSSDATSPRFRDFVNAVAAAQCGPAGGSAVAIYLTPNPVGSVEPSAPFVRVYVPVQVAELTGRTWPIASKNTEVAAWFYPAGATFELAETGYLIVSSVDSEMIVGTLDLHFPDAGHIRSAFRATWIPTSGFCI